MKSLTVGDLRKALEGVPDNLKVRIDSDTGLDQGVGVGIVESAQRMQYENIDYFSIYANDVCCEY